MSDPLEAIKKIGDRLGRVAHDVGLDMASFAVVPDLTGGSHVVQAVFTLQPAEQLAEVADAEEVLDEQAIADREAFEEIVRGADKAEAEQKAADAAQSLLSLRDRLQGDGGFLT